MGKSPILQLWWAEAHKFELAFQAAIQSRLRILRQITRKNGSFFVAVKCQCRQSLRAVQACLQCKRGLRLFVAALLLVVARMAEMAATS